MGKDGETYTGDFINNQRTGQGTYVWANGDTYTGDFINNQRTGQGTYIWADRWRDIYRRVFKW